MAKKYYAIRKGFNINTNEIVKDVILDDWNVASKLVQGINQKQHGVTPEYKSFKTLPEAENYLKDNVLLHKSEMRHSMTALHCYIDGSFSDSYNNYSFGNVYVKDGVVIGIDFGEGNNPEAISMQQIGGELLGAIKSLEFAKKNGYSEVVIFHDYVGVCHHAVGSGWSTDNPLSSTYSKWMQSFFNKNPNIQITFCKVDAHTGDDFNEIADGLAKLALKINTSSLFTKLITKHNVQPLLIDRGVILEKLYG